MSTIPHDTLDELRFRLGGGLYEPGDEQYEDACTLFNAMIERRPRLVARCAAPDDVITALAFAREHGLDVAVRAGGHSVAGLSLCDGGLVLDVRAMNDVDVDPDRRIARVGGGATWAELDKASQEHGLATTGGRVSTTGVAGLTLGGGSGWLERKHGLASDNLVAVELVTADGQLVRASETQHPELFWALRGGGGNFGVVTAFEFRLHPVGPEVFGGLVVHPADRGPELLALWRDVMRTAPEELSLAFVYMKVPEEPDFPESLQGELGAIVVGMHSGPVDEGEKALERIRAFGSPAVDFFAAVPYTELQSSIDDPPGYRNYWTAEHLADLPDAAIERIAARANADVPGLPQVFIVGWGGEVARGPRSGTPLASRRAQFVVHPMALWEEPSDDAALIAWSRGFHEDLAPYATGDAYLNFMGQEGQQRLVAAYGTANYERLARVKAAWDPENVFRATGNVPPAVGARARAA
jgi:FAD/FMN-containing dehydrogenase